MIYKQTTKRVKRYDYNEIFSLHKYAFYGDVKMFKDKVYYTLVEQYTDTLYYCITNGCRFNFEFLDKRYEKAITAMFIRHGKYNPKLFLEDYDYSLYRNIKKEDVANLVEYPELHPILYFVSLLNSFDLSVTPTRIRGVYILEKNYSIPDNSIGTGLTDGFALFFTKFDYSDGELDSKTFANPPGDFKNINNLEAELLLLYIIEGYKESEKLGELNEINIFNDIRYAIESYSQNKNLDLCLSKFALAAPYISEDLIKKHKPFLSFGNHRYNVKELDRYMKINSLYRHIFIYSNIMYHSNSDMKLLGDTIDYCYIEACIVSRNGLYLQLLKKKNLPCFKYLDLKNNKIFENPEKVEVDYDVKLKFDLSYYKYI